MAMMTVDQIDISNLRSLGALLTKLPQGEAARTLATALGTWTSSVHDNPNRGRSYPNRYADMSHAELSDTYATWNHELARAIELCGLLEGLGKYIDILGKQHRAAARADTRRRHAADNKKVVEDGGKPTNMTASELNDRAEEDEAVRDTEMVRATLEIASASAKAYKEACLATTTGLSREISLRQAQMQARL